MKNTERMINDFYLSIGVDKLACLNMFYISDALNFNLHFDNQHSKIYLNHAMQLFILDNRLDKQTQREDFFHLLAQYLIYDTTSTHLHHVEAFKTKVDHLTLLLAIPQHLLPKVDLTDFNLAHKLSQMFNISHEMAQKRVNQIKT
ncbi:hypothetical protein PNU83_09150 [Turicibacter sanguinis]|uniref:hypothetical protein n=1 Tax=Turicibacter sanguinis TaxID=154288 RepID=UPI0018AC8B8E|nr:hypothetical protein [Turicibacter sanguinis]MDB8564281.1 hypothetical protein [Turicibacter sanguinis]